MSAIGVVSFINRRANVLNVQRINIRHNIRGSITVLWAVGRVPPGRYRQSYHALKIKLQEHDQYVRDEDEHALSGGKWSERGTSPLSEMIIVAGVCGGNGESNRRHVVNSDARPY